MAVAKKVHVLDCGAMSCDLTWLLLKPGRSIRPRADRDQPVERHPSTTHAELVETDEGTMLWDPSCPRDWETRWVPTGLQAFLPYDQVTDEQYLGAWYSSVEKMRGIAEKTDATVVFGHDADQLRGLRLAPEGSYT